MAIIRKRVEGIGSGLSNETVVELTGAKAAAVAARAAANQAANLAFDQASLPGVGEATWRVIWDAAREYSIQVAYRGCSFPHVEDGSKCPLCQQVLDEFASKRLADFGSFVKGEVESKAKAAEARHEVAVKALPALPAGTDWLAHFASIPDAEEPARTAWVTATARRTAVVEAMTPDGVPGLDLAPLLGLVGKEVTALEAERELLKKAQEASERPKMQMALGELRMLDWCNENLKAILVELERLKKVAILKDAIKKTNTAALTTKKNELAREELTSGYEARFKDELNALGGARILVKVVTSAKKAKLEFALKLVGARENMAPTKVLSEGEARVVALAVFLADVTVAGARTPFIFDDPISSLDQEFEERVVARLLTLARTRQVLVFTHRLSLVSLLDAAVSKDSDAAKAITDGKAVRKQKISLCRLDTRVGLVTQTNVWNSDVKAALNDLIGRRLGQAKRLVDEGHVDEYTIAMTAICHDIRVLIERVVEETLLNQIVRRFRRSVTTQNRLLQLPKIVTADCTFLDGLMTRFSTFEHSQPRALHLPEAALHPWFVVGLLHALMLRFALDPSPSRSPRRVRGASATAAAARRGAARLRLARRSLAVSTAHGARSLAASDRPRGRASAPASPLPARTGPGPCAAPRGAASPQRRSPRRHAHTASTIPASGRRPPA